MEPYRRHPSCPDLTSAALHNKVSAHDSPRLPVINRDKAKLLRLFCVHYLNCPVTETQEEAEKRRDLPSPVAPVSRCETLQTDGHDLWASLIHYRSGEFAAHFLCDPAVPPSPPLDPVNHYSPLNVRTRTDMKLVALLQSFSFFFPPLLSVSSMCPTLSHGNKRHETTLLESCRPHLFCWSGLLSSQVSTLVSRVDWSLTEYSCLGSAAAAFCRELGMFRISHNMPEEVHRLDGAVQISRGRELSRQHQQEVPDSFMWSLWVHYGVGAHFFLSVRVYRSRLPLL